MEQTFSIPTPCHEAWSEMTPNEQGRHCAICSQTVVDFSTWSTEAINEYLYIRRSNSVCGRMRLEQATEPSLAPATYIYRVMQSGLDFFKKIAAILLFAVCIGDAAAAQTPVPPADTIRPMIMGKMIAPSKPPVKHPKPLVRPKVIKPVMGQVATPANHPTERNQPSGAAK